MEPHRQRLGRLRVGMVVVALANLVLGFAGEAAGKGTLPALGFDGFAALVWGFLYAILVVMVPVRPGRIMVAAIGFAVVDGLRLTFAAGDAGGSPPWLALLLRGGFAALAVAAAFAASQAAEEAAWARHPPPFVAKVNPSGPSARAASAVSPTARTAAVPQPTPPTPAPGVRLPRVTSSVLTTGSRTPAFSLRSPSAKVDSAASALRFVVTRCQVMAEGLQGTLPGGSVRVLPWSDVRALWVRMLPPDPPWDSQIVFDVVPGFGEPIRVFATTFLQWPQGGRPSTSRLENLRRLATHIAAQVPELGMDEATRGFVQGGGPVGQLMRFVDLAERDAGYSTERP